MWNSMYILGYLHTPNQGKNKKKHLSATTFAEKCKWSNSKQNKHLHSQTIVRKLFTPLFKVVTYFW